MKRMESTESIMLNIFLALKCCPHRQTSSVCLIYRVYYFDFDIIFWFVFRHILLYIICTAAFRAATLSLIASVFYHSALLSPTGSRCRVKGQTPLSVSHRMRQRKDRTEQHASATVIRDATTDFPLTVMER